MLVIVSASNCEFVIVSTHIYSKFVCEYLVEGNHLNATTTKNSLKFSRPTVVLLYEILAFVE